MLYQVLRMFILTVKDEVSLDCKEEVFITWVYDKVCLLFLDILDILHVLNTPLEIFKRENEDKLRSS